MKWEGLSGVVLCGHSYGGMVVSGVAEQMADQIASIVFLDAFVPENGDALMDLTGPFVQTALRVAQQKGDPGIPPRPAELFAVNEADRAWVDSKCVPQPIDTFTQAMKLTGAHERIGKKAYIRAANYVNPGFDKALERIKTDKSWRTYGVPCGHDVMVDMPDRLTEILLEVA